MNNESKMWVDSLIALHSRTDVPANLSRQLDVWVAFRQLAREFVSVNWDESTKLAKRYRAQPKQCFRNARTIALRRPELRYYEGFATHLMTFEHAWLVGPNGTVFDPTLSLIPEILADPSGIDYYGVEVSAAQLMEPRNDQWEPRWLRTVLQTLPDWR